MVAESVARNEAVHGGNPRGGGEAGGGGGVFVPASLFVARINTDGSDDDDDETASGLATTRQTVPVAIGSPLVPEATLPFRVGFSLRPYTPASTDLVVVLDAVTGRTYVGVRV